MLNTVLLEPQTATSKEDICLAGRGEIGDAVADEYDERNLVRFALLLGFCACLVHALAFVVSRFGVVAPDGFPRDSAWGF